MDFGDRSLKSQMKRADRLNAAHVLIVGDDELAKGIAPLRDMTTKEQVVVSLDKVVEEVKAKIKV
jgi:histidyl-tRNA synthetase